MQPSADERCARITSMHLRDLQALLTISFFDASVNIGDAGTKHGRNNALMLEFMTTGRFAISYAGRKGQAPRAKG